MKNNHYKILVACIGLSLVLPASYSTAAKDRENISINIVNCTVKPADAVKAANILFRADNNGKHWSGGVSLAPDPLSVKQISCSTDRGTCVVSCKGVGAKRVKENNVSNGDTVYCRAYQLKGGAYGMKIQKGGCPKPPVTAFGWHDSDN